MLRNLLQREGYADLEAVLKEGRREGLEEGREEGIELGLTRGLVSAIRSVCATLAIPLEDEQERQLASLRPAELETLHVRLLQDRRWPDGSPL